MKNPIQYPKNLLRPIAEFLNQQLVRLEQRLKSVSGDDPFTDPLRTSVDASPDADAAEQFGHARVTAIRVELDRKIIQTKKALAQIKIGKYGICESCGNMIDTDRLMIYPETTFCISCKKKREK